jgi:hypothetical protein
MAEHEGAAMNVDYFFCFSGSPYVGGGVCGTHPLGISVVMQKRWTGGIYLL